MAKQETDDVLQTPLHEMHVEAGARLVPFAGYSMPLQFSDGILTEHLHTRAAAGLFDVSHMGQILLRGTGVAAALERLIPADVGNLPDNHSVYSVFTNPEGGILDDLIVTRWSEDSCFLVVNAGCKQRDIAHLRAHLPGIELQELADYALLALQGPRAAEVMSELIPAALDLVFMTGMHGQIGSVDCYVTRSGYTGEDGFEISIPAAGAPGLLRRLLAIEAVKPVGLGARDSLRLEAGLCLYGHDLDETTTPVEAGLAWSIARPRRAGGAREGGFPGAERILKQLAEGPGRRRVGLAVEGRAPVREGAELLTESGELVGRVSSGGFGPSLAAPIAMGYVHSDCAQLDTALLAMVRGKPRPVRVVRMPFVEHRYHRG